MAGAKSLILMPSLAKKSFSFTYWPFSAAPPIHWLSPMIRSHSLPLEFSSLSMRSAKFGQGTNSNFILMPVLVVKSFDNSTSAFAGSQAAQHRVMVLSCASAAVLPRLRTAVAASAGSLLSSDFMTGLLSMISGHGHTHPTAVQCRFSAVKISIRGCTTLSAPRTFSHSARSTRAAAEMQ